MFGCKTTKHTVNKNQKYTLKDVLQLHLKVKNEIPYKAEQGDYWQTPTETLKLKNGDCEDKAILLQYLFMLRGIQSKIIIGTTQKPKGEIESYHAWNEVIIGNKVYIVDSTAGYFDEKKIDRHMFFQTVLPPHAVEFNRLKEKLRSKLSGENLEKVADSITF
jgi:transglutaminase/protease-like cytokinesis protein 3